MKQKQLIILIVVVIILIGGFILVQNNSQTYRQVNPSTQTIENSSDLNSVNSDLDQADISQMDTGLSQLNSDSSSF